MLPPQADVARLTATLSQLTSAVEELLLSGLTTASDSTRQTLNVAIQEAARYRLLRLGSTLRLVLEELGRFTSQDVLFSRRRLAFFLSRAWLLGRGLGHGLQHGNEKEFDRLNWSPANRPLADLEVVCMGVSKKVATGAYVAFEFRLRAVNDAAPVAAGQKLTWSIVCPAKGDARVPPEAFLHLPQKQKFTPYILLEKKKIAISNANVSIDEAGLGRLTLTEQSTMVLGEPYEKWQRFLDWSPASAREQIQKHVPGPLDLETELQTEVVLKDYTISAAEQGESAGQSIYPVSANGTTYSALVVGEVEGKALTKKLEELRKLKKKRPPLYGLLHYERCRLIFQPLAIFDPDPDYLTISSENVNKAALLKALKLT
jgi:hypothetical protein